MAPSLQNVLGIRSSRAAVLPVVLALSVMLSATPALAQAQRVRLNGSDYRLFGAVASVTASGDWLFFTGQQLDGTFDFGALAGTESQLVDAKLNTATGSGRMAGTVSYTDTATGVTCSGTIEGKITNFLAIGKVLATCSDGATLQLALQDVHVTPGVDGTSNYEGGLTYPQSQ